MRVETMYYEFSHGKKPRGFGMWAFKIDGDVHFFLGAYTEVKRQAIAAAKELGVTRIEVMP